MVATIAITAGEKSYTAYGLVGRRRAVVRVVDRLRELVGLAESRRGGPVRHAAR